LPNLKVDASMKALRRLLSIALLAVFGLPFVSPLMAITPKSDTAVPLCCRRDGKHHCSQPDQSSLAPSGQALTAPPEKCPFYPASIAIIHKGSFAPPTTQAVFAGLIAHPAVVAQTESKLRISRIRSRQKRGPPSSFSL
jgi:hypothetical protein